MARTTPGNYVPLDVNYARDAAVRAAGEAAELLYVRGLAYCKSARSDGFVPEYDLPVVAVGLRLVPRRVAALVSHGLWRPVDGGWIVRSWTKWNKPASTEEAFIEGQAKYGTKGNHERWHVGRGVTDPTCVHCSNPNRLPDREPDPRPESPIREGKGSTKAKALGRTRPPTTGVEDPTAQTVLGAWIDKQRRRPANSVIGQVGKHIKALLAEDFTSEQIASGLDAMDTRQLHPSTLPSLVTAAANVRSLRPAPAGQQTFADGTPMPWDR